MKQEQPTVLPWHAEKAAEIERIVGGRWTGATRRAVAEHLVRHDPHAAELIHAKQEWAIRERNVVACEKEIAALRAQHAETLRLLEAALPCIYFTNNSGKAIPEHIELYDEIRAHLAAMKGTKCQH